MSFEPHPFEGHSVYIGAALLKPRDHPGPGQCHQRQSADGHVCAGDRPAASQHE